MNDDTEATPAPTRALPPGTRVGRYVLLDEIGAGGMGVIYKAYDPQLERPIALKLVRAVGSDEAVTRFRERLGREAQALAQLSHPNVVSVHDVGSFGESVFIAMEFVEGKTLTRWVKEQARRPEEILAIYLAAGEGLAAAHHAGLVHRDFKPDNVMIGVDGRVRVLDFGLARNAHIDTPNERAAPARLPSLLPSLSGNTEVTREARPMAERRPVVSPPESPVESSVETTPSSPSSSPGHSSGSLLATPLTRAGSVLGTPRFMAPEQHLGYVADERADQFSFCVSLYHSLYQAFPFDGDTAEEMVDCVLAGKVAEPPPGTRVPRWLRQVLLRGLAREPGDRHASMAALLQALRADPQIARRRQARLALTLALVAGIAAAWGVARRREVRACAGADQKLAGIWDDARRGEVRAAFAASGKPYAETAFATVARVFDGYARDWVKMHVDTCEATHVRGEQSQELLDLRMSCLSDRLTQLKTLSDLYRTADGSVVEHAAQSAQALPGLNQCADTTALRAPIPPPADVPTRQRVDAVRDQLARAHALGLAAKYAEAIAVARAAVTDAAATRYQPVVAEAQLRLGAALGDRGDYAESAEALHRALVAAFAGHHDEIAAVTASSLMQSAGNRLSHYAEGERWAELAEALASRLQSKDELLGDVYTKRSDLFRAESKYDEALKDATRARELLERIHGPDHSSLADTWDSLGLIHFFRAEYAEALTAYQNCLAIRQRTLGPDHPSIVGTLIGMADVYGESGDHERALPLYRQALATLLRTQPDHPNVAVTYNNLGSELLALGRPKEAIGEFQQALTRWQKRNGPSVDTALALSNLGFAKIDMEEPGAALPYFQQALEMCQKVAGADHELNGRILGGMGDAYLNQNKLDEAQTYFRRALTVREKALGPKHPELLLPLIGLGKVALKRGAAASAKAPLERALAIANGSPGNEVEAAEIQMSLAKVAWAAGDRRRAVELAVIAHDGYAKAGASAKNGLAEATAWLGQHR